MPLLGPVARNLLWLLAMEALVRGLVPDAVGDEPRLVAEWTQRGSAAFPLVVFAAFPSHFISLLLGGLPLLGRISARAGFVAGLTMIGGGLIARGMATALPAFLVGRIVENAGIGLFAAAAFVLQAETVPRRWLLLGPTLYFAVHTLAEYAAPALPEIAAFPSAKFLIGGVAVLMLAAAATGLRNAPAPGETIGEETVGNETAGDEVVGEGIAKRSVGRVFALVALLSLALSFLASGAARSVTPDLGQIAGWDAWSVIRIAVRDVIPFALLLVFVLRDVAIGRAARGLGLLMIGTTALAWAVPILRWAAHTMTYEFMTLIEACLTIAFVRRVRAGRRLLLAYAIEVVVATAGWFEYLTVGLRWEHHPRAETEPYPVGITVSLAVVLLGAAFLLLAPPPASTEDEPATPVAA